jgi:hypothetical protein
MSHRRLGQVFSKYKKHIKDIYQQNNQKVLKTIDTAIYRYNLGKKIIVASTIGGTSGYLYYIYGTQRTMEITVKTKNTFHGSSGSSLMICDDKDKLYRIKTSYMYLQFRADELWSKLEEGKTYKMSVYGHRVRPFYIYPVVLSAMEIKEKK